MTLAMKKVPVLSISRQVVVQKTFNSPNRFTYRLLAPLDEEGVRCRLWLANRDACVRGCRTHFR